MSQGELKMNLPDFAHAHYQESELSKIGTYVARALLLWSHVVSKTSRVRVSCLFQCCRVHATYMEPAAAKSVAKLEEGIDPSLSIALVARCPSLFRHEQLRVGFFDSTGLLAYQNVSNYYTTEKYVGHHLVF